MTKFISKNPIFQNFLVRSGTCCGDAMDSEFIFAVFKKLTDYLDLVKTEIKVGQGKQKDATQKSHENGEMLE